MSLKMPSKFINREVSWLSFNERVLQEAEDDSNPIIERMKFLGIFSNNRDEFFRVRVANIRRVAEVSKILMNAGNVVLSSFITPFQKDRGIVKEIVGENNYIEVFVNTSLETCIERDPKGLYQKSKSGLIKSMTGIDSNYEVPKSFNIEISESNTLEKTIEMLYALIKDKLAITNE